MNIKHLGSTFYVLIIDKTVLNGQKLLIFGHFFAWGFYKLCGERCEFVKIDYLCGWFT